MNLRTRLFSISMGLAAVMTAVMVADRVNTQRSALIDKTQSRSSDLADLASEAAIYALRNDRPERLAELFSPFGEMPQVVYIKVLDRNGRPVHRAGAIGVDIDSREIDASVADVEDGVYDLTRALIKDDEKWGTLRLGISTESISESVARALRRGLLIALGFLALLAALLWRISALGGRDMAMLVKAAGGINSRTLPPLPEADDTSEVGRLSGALSVLHSGLKDERSRRKELESSRKDFFAMAVHDLKQPLTVLKAVNEMILDSAQAGRGGKEDGELEKISSLSGESIDRLHDMVEDLLNISRLDSPDIPLDKRRIDLHSFLRDCSRDFSAAAERAGRRWSFSDESGRGAWIYGDEKLLKRLVGNLVMNAVQYTPEGAQIQLGARRAEGDHRVEIYVRDEGKGIPEELRAAIFEKYRTFSENNRNVGLGLAFCKMAAERHSGEIKVSSAPGKGTEIAVSLPSSGQGEDNP
ncbi:MAG: HAMP domain-containing sensor histidine kinase [Elusimicrobiales bacterium]|nr:HAMP domain-containing sensor histidine kinase [Elusimicrobiales bacterium]